MSVTGLALWQEILLLGLATISLIYVLYFRIWIALAMGADLLFALALCLAIASVVLPQAFASLSTGLVDRSPLPAALESADAHVARIEALPRTLLDRALEKLGYGGETAELGSDPGIRELEAQPGPFASRIRPACEALLTGVLRTFSFVGACALLLLALSLRSATSSARAVHELSRRIDGLEQHLAERTEQAPA